MLNAVHAPACSRKGTKTEIITLAEGRRSAPEKEAGDYRQDDNISDGEYHPILMITQFQSAANDIPLPGREADTCKISAYYMVEIRASTETNSKRTLGLHTIGNA